MPFGLQLICHLLGDYVFQNHAMAAYKKKSIIWAIIHVLFYSIPFAVCIAYRHWDGPLPDNLGVAMAILMGTHVLIDRYSLHLFWVKFWGIGQPSTLFTFLGLKQPEKEAPPFLQVWLRIIVDNICHLCINMFAFSLVFPIV